jgi:chromate transporter
MSQAVQERNVEQSVPLAALFIAFLTVSLMGFGGGLVWARRIVVETRRWISDHEFADIVSLCQFMPGPNIVGIAVCIGAKTRGAIGTIAAISGFLLIPWGAGLALGLLYLKYAHLTVLRNILGGVAATAPGSSLRQG